MKHTHNLPYRLQDALLILFAAIMILAFFCYAWACCDRVGWVRFLGGKHYVNAFAAAGTAARAGKASITTIFQPEKSKHPYHLVYVAGGGSNVYGWVDKGSFEKV